MERTLKNEKLATLGTQDTRTVLIYISVNTCIISYTTLSVSTCMMFKQQITTMPKIYSIYVLFIRAINALNISIYSEFNSCLH